MAGAFRVFLCSTYDDLVEERKAVLATLEDLKLAHESMELFGARPGSAIDECLAEVAKSSVVVVIVGHRYGSLVPKRDISFTEAEYREGFRLNKPCLVYMRHEDVPVLPKFFETDGAKLTKLRAFREMLNSRHTVARFRVANDLAEAVRSAVRHTVKAIEREATKADRAEDALVLSVTELAREALANGHNPERIAAAFRMAVQSLEEPKPSMGRVMRDAARRMLLGEWVFFSFARQDIRAIEPVAEELRKLGFPVWLDAWALPPSAEIIEGVRSGLNKARVLVFFASEASLRSASALQELDYFTARRVKANGALLIPVLLEDVELPGILRDRHAIDLRHAGPRNAARQIAAAMRR
jgi:hypothetical protein